MLKPILSAILFLVCLCATAGTVVVVHEVTLQRETQHKRSVYEQCVFELANKGACFEIAYGKK